jgi:Spy/CpxP family protein refolding chaperone
MTRFAKLVMTGMILAGAVLSTLAVAGSGKGEEGCDHRDKFMEHHGMHGHHFGSERWLEMMTGKLELNDDQRTQVQTILDSAKTESRALRESMRDNMKAERSAADSGASERELKKLARKTADSRVDLMLFGQGVEGKVRAVLTDEQNARLDEMKASRKAHREGRMEKWQQRMDAKAKSAE